MEQFSKRGGRSTSFEALWGGGGAGGRGGGDRGKVGAGGVRLWTFKMVYLVPTQYFLIQLQLISHLLILIV